MSRNAVEPGTESRRHLVLVGGGHSHVQVLRHFIMQPPAGLRTTLVVDTPIAVYSGMVPGFVAGQYTAEELEIDVVPLARRAGAEVVMSAATGVDPETRRVLLDGRPPLAYDLASFDVGSTVLGLDLPGVRRHALPTRPIARLVRRVSALLARKDELARRPRVVVVGGGAGGVELAFTLDARLRREGREPEVTLVNAGERLLQGFPAGLARRTVEQARRRGIRILPLERVTSIDDRRVELAGGEPLPADLVVWVAGATSLGLLKKSGLATDDRGFVLVRSTLQVDGFDDLFAVGDCATLRDFPKTAKAGVYAVRQGPFLTHNLLAAAEGRPLRRYRPQRDFMTLLNLGDGTALGAKWGASFGGRWVMKLKDWIDRRFMVRFQALSHDGSDPGGVPVMEGGGEMICGGCAAKLGQSPLARALARLDLPADEPPVVFGVAAAEDAVAHEIAGGATVVSSLDAFRPFSADPYLVARVAAVNAASDLLAKGVLPRYAQALVAVPDAFDDPAREEYLFQLLSGARALLEELGATLLGGHTTTAPEPLIGFQMEGVAPPTGLLRKAGARPGDALVLTKPLGTGVVLFADMRGRCRGPWLEAAHAAMLSTNRAAMEAAVELGASASTDVTGFGLAGHLGELLRASDCSARVGLSRLPSLPGAVELLARGERSTFHPENRKGLKALAVDAEARRDPRLELLFDPQTSGGLLLAVPAERARELVDRLGTSGGPEAAIVGEVTPPGPDGAAAFSVEP